MRRTLFAGAALLLAGAAAAADTHSIDSSHSEVSFQVRHIVTKVRGHFRDFSGSIVMDREEPARSSVTFTIDAASIDTANADRDKHLRSADFFDVEKHPKITFTSSKVEKTGDDAYRVTGTLDMHGTKKEITLPVTFLGTQKDPWGNVKGGFETEVTLNRKDFDITWNKALDSGSLILGDEVKVAINLETKLEASKAAQK